MTKEQLLEKYLRGTNGYYTVENGRHILDLPLEIYEYDSLDDMLKDIEYTLK